MVSTGAVRVARGKGPRAETGVSTAPTTNNAFADLALMRCGTAHIQAYIAPSRMPDVPLALIEVREQSCISVNGHWRPFVLGMDRQWPYP
jgi:hypothetical protein